MAIDTRRKEYICPGERHPISRSIHLARLAASFPACRHCPLREDHRRIVLKSSAPATPERPSALPGEIFKSEGIRGIFLNELTRGRAESIAAAFGTLLWNRSPISGRNDGIDRGARQVRPTVVTGYDERLSSPAIFSSVAAGLRRVGCHVIDIGLAAKPCFAFAVRHLHASGGLFVSGSGCEPSWTGIDFCGDAACPFSLPGTLASLRELAQRPLSRPSRQPGTQRTFQAVCPYEESLAKHYQEIRPFTVACASSSPLVRQTMERLFSGLPGRPLLVDLPVRVRNPAHRRDADMLRLSVSVRESKADLGVLIDDDGPRCGFVDERGRHVSPCAIARFLVPPLLAERPGSTVLLEPGAFKEMRPLIEALGGKCEPCPGTPEQVFQSFRGDSVLYAGGDSGRHWFVDPTPDNDALVALAKVLVALSQAHAPFSELAAG
jgi:phosphomannomutase